MSVTLQKNSDTDWWYLWTQSQQTESAKIGERTYSITDMSGEMTPYLTNASGFNSINMCVDWSGNSNFLTTKTDTDIRLSSNSDVISTTSTSKGTDTGTKTSWLQDSYKTSTFFNRFNNKTGKFDSNLYVRFNSGGSRKHSWSFKIWYKPYYNITVTEGTGTGTYNLGEQLQLSPINKTGYTFLSWSDNSTVKNRIISVTNDIPQSYSVNWSENSYSVSYNSNTPDNINITYPSVKYTENFNLAEGNIFEPPIFTITYKLNGATEEFYGSKDQVIKNYSRSFEKWKDIQTNILYDANSSQSKLRDGSAENNSVTFEAQWGAASAVLNDIPVRKYHKFIGWRFPGSTDVLAHEEKINFSDNIILEAVWEKTDYRVFSGIENIKKIYLSKNKKIEKIFVGTTEV